MRETLHECEHLNVNRRSWQADFIMYRGTNVSEMEMKETLRHILSNFWNRSLNYHIHVHVVLLDFCSCVNEPHGSFCLLERLFLRVTDSRNVMITFAPTEELIHCKFIYTVRSSLHPVQYEVFLIDWHHIHCIWILPGKWHQVPRKHLMLDWK